MLIRRGGGFGFVAKWIVKWLDSIDYSQQKAHCVEHLLKAVKSMCAADMTVQRAPVKSHASQGHVERTVRLVENPYRALLFDA